MGTEWIVLGSLVANSNNNRKNLKYLQPCCFFHAKSSCTTRKPFDNVVLLCLFLDTLVVRGYTINSSEIAWKTDRDSRYRNPPAETNPYETDRINTGRGWRERRDRKGEGDWIDFLLIFSPGTILPPNWLTLIDHGQRNESFMVWFRVAAFPVFRKLYGRIAPPNDEPLRAGNYTIDVVYSTFDLFLLPSPPFP